MRKQAIILIGYDVEARNSYGDFYSTRLFLERAVVLHDYFQIPCTTFVLGQTLIENKVLFRELLLNPLWNIEQHTFTHIPLRNVSPVCEMHKAVKGASLETIEHEISTTNELFLDILGIRCKGLCAPKGYFQGLKGRKDILSILSKNGIHFVRSYGRNEKDWQPVAFEIQPFWYEQEGAPEILEIPSQGWQDTIWFRVHGWNNRNGFVNYLKTTIDHVVQNRLVWSCGFHDWSCAKVDPGLDILKDFFEYALNKGAVFMTHLEFYNKMLREKNEGEDSIC